MNLPNALSLLRIVLIPVLVAVFYLGGAWAHVGAALIFAVASVTDWLDGYLARRWEMTTRFGAFIDPVADKLIVAVALVLIVQTDPRPALALAASIIIGREIVISALREWMAEIGKRTAVAVSMVGKVKTSAQMAALFFMLWGEPLMGLPLPLIGEWLLYLAALLTLWSMLVYLRAAWPELRAGQGGE